MSATDETKKRFCIMCRMLFKLYRFVTRKEVGEDVACRRDAMRAVYNLMNQRRAAADTSELMHQVRDIVSAHIEVSEASDQAKERTRFDISGIDFGRLGQEFTRAKHKHLIMDNLHRRVIILSCSGGEQVPSRRVLGHARSPRCALRAARASCVLRSVPKSKLMADPSMSGLRRITGWGNNGALRAFGKGFVLRNAFSGKPIGPLRPRSSGIGAGEN